MTLCHHIALVIALLGAADPAIAQMSEGAPAIRGGTDGTQIGNTGDRLKVDSAGTAIQMYNATDVSTTVTASGNSSGFDTQGMAFINYTFSVTAISGSGAYIQFHVQTSDDNSNWTTYADTARLTATGQTRYQAFRQGGRYYRYSWDVAGSTPSITFNIITTLKPYAPPRKSVRFFYSDIDLTTNDNVSSAFNADDCRNIALSFSRGADGGNNATVKVNGGLDGVNWFSLTGSLNASVSSANTTTFFDSAYRLYQVVVTAHTNAGTRTLDIEWSCN